MAATTTSPIAICSLGVRSGGPSRTLLSPKSWIILIIIGIIDNFHNILTSYYANNFLHRKLPVPIACNNSCTTDLKSMGSKRKVDYLQLTCPEHSDGFTAQYPGRYQLKLGRLEEFGLYLVARINITAMISIVSRIYLREYALISS